MAVLGVIGDYREQVNSVQITGREEKKKDLAIVRTGVLYSKKKNEKYPPDVWVNSGFLHSRLVFFCAFPPTPLTTSFFFHHPDLRGRVRTHWADCGDAY